MSRFQEKLEQVNQLLAQKQFSQALQQSRKLNRERPAVARAWLARSEAARSLAQFDEAVKASSKAYELEPGSGFAIAQYARCLLPGADYRLLGPLLEKGLEVKHESSWATEILASCAVGIDAWPQARRYYQLLVEQHGTRAQYRHMLAVACNVLGEVDLAVKHLKRIIRQQPEFAPAYWTLLDVAPERVTEEMQKQVAAYCDDNRLQENQKLFFYHTRASLCHRAQDHAAAFRWYSRANAVKRGQINYSGDTDKALFAGIQRTFDVAPTLPKTKASAKTSAKTSAKIKANTGGPVFIVGLPRSGSTLVEQLLVNSGEVVAPGELRDFEVLLAEAAGCEALPVLYADVVERLQDADFPALGENYLARVAGRVGEGQRIVDKNPFNFRFIGMILRALPDARIVHVHKSPLDACLGNFRHQFASVAPWSYTLDELALYYRLYTEMMQHWEAQFPKQILSVAYDELISEPEKTARSLYKHCGLKWQKQALAPVGHEREIHSASASQVRGGLNDRALNVWRQYEAELQPLRRRLESWGLV